jgi:hypothetical protein
MRKYVLGFLGIAAIMLVGFAAARPQKAQVVIGGPEGMEYVDIIGMDNFRHIPADEQGQFTINAVAHLRNHVMPETFHWSARVRDLSTKQIVWRWEYDKPVTIERGKSADLKFAEDLAMPPGRYRIWVGLIGSPSFNRPGGEVVDHNMLGNWALVDIE